MKKRNAFTLIEILIVLVIVAMLMGVLFEVYITISRITFRVEHQKYVNEELQFMTNTLQNFSNRNSINYTEYSGKNLVKTGGITDRLCLSGIDGKIALYSKCNSGFCDLYMRTTGDCFDKDGSMNKNFDIKLTSSSRIYFSDVKFKIIPFESPDNADGSCEKLYNVYACRNHPGFWFMANIYTTGYDQDRWTNNVSMTIQQFFNN